MRYPKAQPTQSSPCSSASAKGRHWTSCGRCCGGPKFTAGQLFFHEVQTVVNDTSRTCNDSLAICANEAEQAYSTEVGSAESDSAGPHIEASRAQFVEQFFVQ